MMSVTRMALIMETIVPTERSMPPVMITMVMPMARIATTAIWLGLKSSRTAATSVRKWAMAKRPSSLCASALKGDATV